MHRLALAAFALGILTLVPLREATAATTKIYFYEHDGYTDHAQWCAFRSYKAFQSTAGAETADLGTEGTLYFSGGHLSKVEEYSWNEDYNFTDDNYFSDDAKLRRLHREVFVFDSDVYVEREYVFQDGKPYRQSIQFLDANTKRPRPAPENVDLPPQKIYRELSGFPYASLIQNRALLTEPKLCMPEK